MIFSCALGVVWLHNCSSHFKYSTYTHTHKSSTHTQSALKFLISVSRRIWNTQWNRLRQCYWRYVHIHMCAHTYTCTHTDTHIHTCAHRHTQTCARMETDRQTQTHTTQCGKLSTCSTGGSRSSSSACGSLLKPQTRMTNPNGANSCSTVAFQLRIYQNSNTTISKAVTLCSAK